MAVGTEQVLLLTVPKTCSPAVNPRFPIPQLRAMTLTAKLIGFFVIDQIPSSRVEHVSIGIIVAIQAPSVLFIMLEFDVVVEFFQLSSLKISFHVSVTFRAGKDILTKGRRRHLDILLLLFGRLMKVLIEGHRLVIRQEEKAETHQYQ